MTRILNPRDPSRWLRLAAFALLLLFWAFALAYLDRLPHLNFDEPWILSPGLKFFTQGIFGSDMFTGLSGMERNYFEFMPLLSLLQGAGAQMWGIGIWQLRFVTVMVGAVTLALLWRVGVTLGGTRVGIVAILLLLFWQWTPGENPDLSSGLALLDLSRLARYDILVAPLGLGAFWAWLVAHRSHRTWLYALAGILSGVAGLAHPHGLLWVLGLGILILFKLRARGWRRTITPLVCFAAGAALPWSGYAIWALANWSDWSAQARFRQGQVDFLSLDFYVRNLTREPRRYMLGLRSAAFWSRVGTWFILLGIPVATVALAVVAFTRRRFELFALLVLALVFPLVLTFLIYEKRFYYLISPILIWTLLLAYALVFLAQKRPVFRFLVLGWLALLVLQGADRVAITQQEAQALPSQQQFMAQLAPFLAGSERILGPTEDYLAAPTANYRSNLLPVYLARPTLAQPVLTFDAALEQTRPELVIASDMTFNPTFESTFQSFLQRHHARVIQSLQDYEGKRVLLYRLEQPAP